MPKYKHSRLIDNISSDYLSSRAVMHRRNVCMVYVEGYEDISFWRSVFDEYETEELKFEITTPVRDDMAKGKKVVLNFVPQSGERLLLCVDSDFDYLFGSLNDQSRAVNDSKYVIQTYVYAIENLMCYPPSLRSVAVKATKNDADIFDFEGFLLNYSMIIYPLFLWYIYAAKVNRPGIFPLSEFRNSVRINFLDVDDNGEATLAWLGRQVEKKLKSIVHTNGSHVVELEKFEKYLHSMGVRNSNVYFFMQGHCLMDNVVKIVLDAVCDRLRKSWVDRIMQSSRQGLPLKNELSYYNNSLRDVDSLLLDNTNYKSCEWFQKVRLDLEKALKVVKISREKV